MSWRRRLGIAVLAGFLPALAAVASPARALADGVGLGSSVVSTTADPALAQQTTSTAQTTTGSVEQATQPVTQAVQQTTQTVQQTAQPVQQTAQPVVQTVQQTTRPVA